jgi:hypothetical protein
MKKIFIAVAFIGSLFLETGVMAHNDMLYPDAEEIRQKIAGDRNNSREAFDKEMKAWEIEKRINELERKEREREIERENRDFERMIKAIN